MKKTWKYSTLMLALAAMTAVASAKIYKKSFGVPLPGADRYGNLDFDDLGNGSLSLRLNSRTGNVLASAKGYANNDSRRFQFYGNRNILDSGYSTSDVNGFIGQYAKLRYLIYSVHRPRSRRSNRAMVRGFGNVKLNKNAIKDLISNRSRT